MSQQPLFISDGSPQQRRRAAPRVEETSDVHRLRGLWIAIVLAAVAVAGVVWSEPIVVQRAPGPLSLPHVDAGLQCTSCHRDERPAVTACTGCHGAHPSTRAGHRRAVEAGRMRCSACHRVHLDFGGVAFASDGSAQRFGPGAQQTVSGLDTAVSRGAVVPLVPAGACGACHDPADDEDPIARCLVAGQDELGEARPTVCFDEHRSLTAATLGLAGSARQRLPLWEAAREVAARAPAVPRATPERPPAAVWLALAGALAGLGWGTARLVDGRRRRRRAHPPVATAASHAAASMAVAAAPPPVRRLPQVDTSTCIGCSACVDVCPYDVLELRNYVAVVSRPDDCCGLTLCEQRCPNGSLRITQGEPIEDRPRIGPDGQSLDVPGVYLAGDLTGLPLIRNAINQGAAAVREVGASLRGVDRRARSEIVDVVVVGAGPAGLSAALQAQVEGLSCHVLEQASVAESIRSFPRGKLVFDQPLGVPLVGDLWLQESSKEELLGHWLRIVRRHRLPIAEAHRVTALQRTADGNLRVRAAGPGGVVVLTARRVVLAIGRRGSPRKLDVPIPDGVMDRVHYSLADARSFAGRRTLVVGLGDVAMETAIALARQRDTRVTLIHRGAEFRRGKRRNIAEIRRLATAGRIDLRWQTEVEAFTPEQIYLRSPAGQASVAWDAAFVMIGAIAPWAFLEHLGIAKARIDPPAPPQSSPQAPF